jgi:ABC-type lipoprotein release transport system permease subunit
MRNSQYTNDYMDEVLERLRRGERPVTLGAFLARHLHGKARDWKDLYSKSLKNSLTRLGWKPGPSVGGSIAYYPPDWSEGNS